MVIVKLFGGLGNQLFQYAAAKNISSRNNTILKLDISNYEVNVDDVTSRSYRLGIFNIEESFATKQDVSDMIGGYIAKITQSIKPFHLQKCIKEQSFNYDERVEMICGSVYLEGYWQSEKYFKSISDALKKEVTLKKTNYTHLDLKQLMQATNSVAMHIRRGDYATSPIANKYHGLCELSYYYRSLKYINDRVFKAVIFVFSDDITWVKKNIKFQQPVHYVSSINTDLDHIEFSLMTQCKHFIIANSSYSWWGAWLGECEEKIVCAPKKWFNHPINTSDLIPTKWIKT